MMSWAPSPKNTFFFFLIDKSKMKHKGQKLTYRYNVGIQEHYTHWLTFVPKGGKKLISALLKTLNLIRIRVSTYDFF